MHSVRVRAQSAQPGPALRAHEHGHQPPINFQRPSMPHARTLAHTTDFLGALSGQVGGGAEYGIPPTGCFYWNSNIHFGFLASTKTSEAEVYLDCLSPSGCFYR
jgi:hypothetical protein